MNKPEISQRNSKAARYGHDFNSGKPCRFCPSLDKKLSGVYHYTCDICDGDCTAGTPDGPATVDTDDVRRCYHCQRRKTETGYDTDKPLTILLAWKELTAEGDVRVSRVEIVKAATVAEVYDLNKVGWNVPRFNSNQEPMGWSRWLEACELEGDGTLKYSTLML